MEKKKVSELLKNADREAFIDIIAKMSEHGPESEKVIKDWHKRNSEKYHKKAVAGELEECWEEEFDELTLQVYFDILLTACYDVEEDCGLGEMWDAVNEVIKSLDVFEE